MCNPYSPPKLDNPQEEDDIDPNWIYRETFMYTAFLIVLFYIGEVFMRGLKQLCEDIIESLKSLPW